METTNVLEFVSSRKASANNSLFPTCKSTKNATAMKQEVGDPANIPAKQGFNILTKFSLGPPCVEAVAELLCAREGQDYIIQVD